MSLKKFGDNYLKEHGIDAHDVKDEYGCHPVSHYDIYEGDTVTLRDKKGNLFADTELSKEEFFLCYGNCKEDRHNEQIYI